MNVSQARLKNFGLVLRRALEERNAALDNFNHFLEALVQTGQTHSIAVSADYHRGWDDACSAIYRRYKSLKQIPDTDDTGRPINQEKS